MKLYAWYPDGHGQYSFFVMAETEEEARAAVEEDIKRRLKTDSWWFSAYEYYGWGTDHYELEVVDPGVVLVNPND